MLNYVFMELADGEFHDDGTSISKEPLLERRVPQVSIRNDETYGMRLMVDRTCGIPVVHHGGDMIGYHSDMIWLPDQNVGAVILTNGIRDGRFVTASVANCWKFSSTDIPKPMD